MSEPQETIRRHRSFAMVPEALLLDTHVPDFAVRLWAWLDRYASRHESVFPGRERLASELGVSRATIGRALMDLTRAGWITRTQASPTRWVTELHEQPVNGLLVPAPRTESPVDSAVPAQKRAASRLKNEPPAGSKMSPDKREELVDRKRDGWMDGAASAPRASEHKPKPKKRQEPKARKEDRALFHAVLGVDTLTSPNGDTQPLAVWYDAFRRVKKIEWPGSYVDTISNDGAGCGVTNWLDHLGIDTDDICA